MQIMVKGQISLCFVSQEPIIWLSWNFGCIYNVISRSYHEITPSRYEAILAMQIKVKGQISFCFVSQEPIIWLTWNFVCIRNLISLLYFIIAPNWYEAILDMQMKVKVQISLCFVSQDPPIHSSCNFVWTYIVMSWMNTNSIWGHLGYANEGQSSNIPLFWISRSTDPIELLFCMNVYCDQPIILHNNTKLIWDNLGYEN